MWNKINSLFLNTLFFWHGQTTRESDIKNKEIIPSARQLFRKRNLNGWNPKKGVVE